jgi:transketolase
LNLKHTTEAAKVIRKQTLEVPAVAAVAFVLWDRLMKYNPQNPQWRNRDRFVLPNHHGSLFHYSMLYQTGIPVEAAVTEGSNASAPTPMETHTGQVLITAVGIALAEHFLARQFNREHLPLFDHATWAFCPLSELYESTARESAALAALLGLGKLIVFVEVTCEEKEQCLPEQITSHYQELGWNTVDAIEAGNDVEALTHIMGHLRYEAGLPALVFISDHRPDHDQQQQDLPSLFDELAATHLKKATLRGMEAENEWRSLLRLYEQQFPREKANLDKGLALKVNVMRKILDNVILH